MLSHILNRINVSLDIFKKLSVAMLGIFLWSLITAQIYVYYNYDVVSSTIYNSFEALGAFALGYISDKYGRKLTLIHSFLIAFLLLLLVTFWQKNLALFCLIGFFFSPQPILRASLIDNFPNFSRIKLIAFSFAFQNIPWAIYNLFFNLKPKFIFEWSTVLALFGLLLAIFLFKDKHDKHPATSKNEHKVHRGEYKILKYTLFAAVPVQIVYFFVQNLLETYTEEPPFYAILSFGSVVGALIAALYKKTPHNSVLVISYGIGLMLAIIPVSSFFMYRFSGLNMPTYFVVLNCLSGFAVPFIYDIILHTIFVKYRGATCGFLDAIFSTSSLISNALTGFMNLNFFFTLLSLPIFFILSIFWQKRAEKKPL